MLSIFLGNKSNEDYNDKNDGKEVHTISVFFQNHNA